MFQIYISRFMQNKLAVTGGLILVLLSLIAIFASHISPYQPHEQQIIHRLQAPCASHLMGTDDLGRDVFSRIIYSTRISLTIGFIAAGIFIFIGTSLGLLAGFFRGWIETIIMRFVDSMLCFPTFFLILAVIAILEPSIWNIMIVIGITSWMGVSRLIRAEILSLKEREFIEL